MNRLSVTLITVLVVASSPLLLSSGEERPPDEASFADLEQIAEAVRLYENAGGVITDNLVNADTTAFKRRRPRFAQSAEGLVLRIERCFDQGRIVPTGRALDLAIEGSGFLRVRSPLGEIFYTRDGALHVSQDGGLVTSDGWPLVDFPSLSPSSYSKTVIVERYGKMLIAAESGSGSPLEVGKITLAKFDSPTGLKAVAGQNLYAETEESGRALVSSPGTDGLGVLIQGSLEASNVCFEEERLRGRHLEGRLRALLEAAE
jgi:flagellar basal body rod protein FlgG